MARLASLGSRVGTLDTRSARPAPKQTDPLYRSGEYQAWRARVIARAGGRCEWPGCGRAERRMFADHIREVRDDGARFDPANGQCLCGAHHSAKTAAERAKRMAR